MGRFSGLAGIKTNAGGMYFKPGQYEIEIAEIKTSESSKDKRLSVIFEVVVIESDNLERPAGSKPSQVIKLGGPYPELPMGDLKHVVGTLMGLEDIDNYTATAVDPAIPNDTIEAATDREWSQMIEALVAPEQPAKGMRCKLYVFDKEREGKHSITKHVWGPLVVAEAAPA